VRFDIGPIDLGAFCDFNAIPAPGTNGGDVEGWVLGRGHQVNHGYDHLWLCRSCEEFDLHRSFAAPDTMCLLNLRNLIDMGLVPDEHISLKLFFWGGTALETDEAVDAYSCRRARGASPVWSPANARRVARFPPSLQRRVATNTGIRREVFVWYSAYGG
jgi:hypothetical protein